MLHVSAPQCALSGPRGGPGALAVWSRHSSSGGLRRAQRSMYAATAIEEAAGHT